MPRFAANLSMLWQELEPLERFRAARDAGFRYVEMLFPHQLDADRLAGTLRELGLEMVLFDPAPGDWAAGERGLLCIPGREEDFLQTVREAVALARRIGTRRLNALAGILPPGSEREEGLTTAVGNLRRAAPLAEQAGITLLVEPINNVDMPGYFLGTFRDGVEVVRAVDHPSVRLQFDQYHVAMAGDDPIAAYREHGDLVGHVQIADVPGRHQPGTGGQPIQPFLQLLDQSGYDGFVGLEYRPEGSTDESLEWLSREKRGG